MSDERIERWAVWVFHFICWVSILSAVVMLIFRAVKAWGWV